MKKTIAIMGVIVLSFLTISAQAQIDNTKQVQPGVQPDNANRWDPKKNPAVADINAKYKDKYVTSKPAVLTTANIFPVTGKYESSVNADAASVTITLDEENKGLVWIEGLPQGRIKAMLRKSPATYKIPAQKTEDGKEVAEGTLIFDKETNTLSICIGKEFNAADPTTAFVPVTDETVPVSSDKDKKKIAKGKKETEPKAWIYTGTKVENASAMN